MTSISDYDFDSHERTAVEAYRHVAGLYSDFANAIRDVLTIALKEADIRVHSIEARGKDIDSFGVKARTPSEDDPNRPKYEDPLREITDLAGARVITFFLDVVDELDEIIDREFEIIEKADKRELLDKEEKLGYQSVHYLVRLQEPRNSLPEYHQFQWRLAEIQVRTILQHAWAEIEHDVKYKSVAALPASIRRRFLSLAGLLEIADREFQAIDDEHERVRQEATASVAAGQLDDVEVSADSLRQYLDQKFGPDGRMADWNYGYAARMLAHMGFLTLAEVDACIGDYDDDQISRIVWGGRQGQLQRFEDVLLASMGDGYLDRHPYCRVVEFEGFRERREQSLQKLKKQGIPIGHFAPESVRQTASRGTR